MLLIAAVETNSSKVCTGIEVEIDGAANNFFIDKKEVMELINAGESVKGQKLENINLQVLEDRLRKEKWISKAELFFDSKQVLQVKVEENEPVARIFTTGGSSFYIDSACKRLPLSRTLSARVPMFTSFPSDREKLSAPDSSLMADVKTIATYIQADDFWKAQIAQVDITPTGFEMVPTVGNHFIVFGNGDDIAAKFDRLFTFYKQVWTKVGLGAYEKIDVQYKGQVVVTKKGAAASMIDSTKARLAVETLLTNAQKTSDDVSSSGGPVKTISGKETTTSAAANFDTKMRAEKQNEDAANNSNSEKANASIKNTKADKSNRENVKANEKRVPKAVMEKVQ